ncbi:WD40 repeat-like protein [Fomitopsis betulina]|nr:WD40 repeat-like protein [Fomitopsis betulina]
MRTQHTPHSLPAFPVYSSAFISEHELVLGGGGGQSKTGIKNKLRLYRVDNDKVVELLHELELEKGEDAPMSMAAHPTERFVACGVNSSETALKSGANQNCRLFAIEDQELVPSKTQSTLSVNEAEDDFQKVTVFSPSGDFLVAAGTKDLSLLHYPSLSLAASPVHVDKGEIYDASFSSNTLVVATTVNLQVYALPKSDKAAGKEREGTVTTLELLMTVERPTLPGDNAGSSFRSDETVLYTLVNAVPPRTRTKSSPRRAFVCKWNTDTWEVTKLRKVGDKGVTCFDVSPNGQLLAFGSSDYTVGILDAKTLAPLVTILKAHDFPPTTLRFNTASNLLVSGSADNTIRVVTVPDNLGGISWTFWVTLVLTILVLLFAFLAQQMHEGS